MNFNLEHFITVSRGSIVIFLLNLEMVLGHEILKSEKDAHASTVVPVAFPIIAGSGTLTTIMSLKANFEQINFLSGILVNLVLVYSILFNYFFNKKLPYGVQMLSKRCTTVKGIWSS